MRSTQRRYRPPKEFEIKGVLQLGVSLRFELLSTPNLSKTALAKRHGIEPSVLSRLLRLTDLAPEIQDYIRGMAPSRHANAITLGRLLPIARNPDQNYQRESFRKLLLRPARIRLTSRTKSADFATAKIA